MIPPIAATTMSCLLHHSPRPVNCVLSGSLGLNQIRGGWLFAEDPTLSATQACVAWTGEYATLLTISFATPTGNDRGFDFRALSQPSALIIDVLGRERLVISDGSGWIGCLVEAGSVLDGPATILLKLPDARLAFDHLHLVKRLMVALLDSARRIPVPPRAARHRRTVQALRVADALADGASHRDIAIALFGDSCVRSDWDGSSDALRSQVRRLVGLSRTLQHGGWRSLAKRGAATRPG